MVNGAAGDAVGDTGFRHVAPDRRIASPHKLSRQHPLRVGFSSFFICFKDKQAARARNDEVRTGGRSREGPVGHRLDFAGWFWRQQTGKSKGTVNWCFGSV